MIARGSRVLLYALAGAVIAGCIAIAGAPQGVFPAIMLHRVEIFADAGGLPSDAVRRSVAAPLEAALLGTPGVRDTRAYADPGKLELELDFDSSTDPAADLRAVRDVVDGIRDRLPVTNVVTLIEGPEAEPVVTYAITAGSISQALLERRVRAATVAAFTGTPELGRLTVFGGAREANEVVLDERRLTAHGISARDVAAAIAGSTRIDVAGDIVRGGERFPVLTGNAADDPAALVAIRVRAGSRSSGVPIRSLGAVRLAEEPTGTQASFDAKHAVMLNAYVVPDGDAVSLAHEIDARLARLRGALPPDAQITIAWDQTRLIRASQAALRVEMAIGSGIALLVIALFLRDLALTLVAAVVLPVALILTMFALVRAGLRFDLMTLGGLTIAIGLIVDEVIVVVESIARSLAAGGSIGGAIKRIARPLVASTAANIVVFLPLALLSGVSGFFFRALAVTLALALAISSALSLVLAPLLAASMASRTRAVGAPRILERAYLIVLRAVAQWPAVVAGLAFAAVVAAGVMLARTPTDFLPDINEGQFEIKYAMPAGTSPAAADTLATTLERAILLDRAVDHVARLSGVDTNGYVATPPDAGTFRVTLKGTAHEPPFDTLADRLRDAIANINPYVAVEVHQLLEDQINDLSGAPEPVQLIVTGPSQATLTAIAGRLADDVAHVRGVVDTFDGVTWQARGIHARQRAADPASAPAFADAVRARGSGIVALPAFSAEDVPVIVRVGGGAPLSRIADLSAPELTSTISEANGTRLVRVTAGIDDVDLSTTDARIRAAIAHDVAALPAGYHVEVGGAVVAQRAAFVEFASIFAIAVVLVFGVLVAAFESFRAPVIVLAAIPLTPIGVAVALCATKTTLNVASFMGLLLLVGIVVRNGILLVDSALERCRAGNAPNAAIAGAAVERLRPILMTTAAALGALAPLALGAGAGSELERPLAIAVIGGIVSSTALTLVVVPLAFTALYGGWSARPASPPATARIRLEAVRRLASRIVNPLH